MIQACETLNPRIVTPLQNRYLSRPENRQVEFDFTSSFLSIEGLELVAQCPVGNEICRKTLDLRDCWLPATAFTPHPTPLLVNKSVLHSVLFALDRVARGHTANNSSPFSIIASFQKLLMIVEWGFLNQIPSLSAFTRTDIIQMENEIKKGGVISMLRYHSRMESVVARYCNNVSALKKLIKYDCKRPSISLTMLAAAIGTPSLGTRAVPNHVYRQFGELLSTRGWSVHDSFFNKGNKCVEKLSASSLSGLFSHWNLFCEMPEGYDGFSFTPFPNPTTLSKRIGKPDGQTRNLSVEEITSLLSKAHQWLQSAPSPLCRLLRRVKKIIYKANTNPELHSRSSVKREIAKQFKKMIATSPDIDKLERKLEIKICRESFIAGNSKDGELTLADCVSVLTSSCFTVIAIYNARRKTEIAHPVTGLRRQDVGIRDEATGLYSVDFHLNKKGFDGRVGFIVNRCSGKAINTMIKLKNACGNDSDSLFSIPSLTFSESTGRIRESVFDFTRKEYGATGKLFLELALGYNTEVVVNAHAFRRFHAVLFHYQYSNARLSALTQQLGHVSADETMTYITDNKAREMHERIVKRVRRTDADARAEAEAVKALKAEIENECRIVGQEKMANDIVDILLGNQLIGGNFPQYLIRAHRFLCRKVEFAELPVEEQGVVMADLLAKHGRHPKPARHNNCVGGNNNEAKRKHHKGACMPERCLGKKGCMNSCVFQPQLDVMKEDLIKLEEIIHGEDSFDALPIQVIQAEQKHANISRIIELQERNMSRVSQYAEGLRGQGDAV